MMSQKEFSDWCMKHFSKIKMRFVIERESENDSWEEISKRGQGHLDDNSLIDSELNDFKSAVSPKSVKEYMHFDQLSFGSVDRSIDRKD